MKVACVFGGASLFLSCCAATAPCHVPFSYEDVAAWSHLPGMCGHADDQSPINIASAAVTEDRGLHNMVFNVNAQSVDTYLIYDMKTWQVNMPQGAASVEFQGKEFYTSQFHFHSPSEHTIDGVHGGMEAHFVNTAADGQILVVAVIYDVGAESPLLGRLEQVATPHLGDNSPVTMPNPYAGIIRKGFDQSYLHYTGSLTTPPCTNGTEWIIFRTRPTLSAAQLARFRQRMNDPACNMLAVHASEHPQGIPHADWDPSMGVNNRPTQPVGRRAVHSHAYSAPSSQTTGAVEPSTVLMAQQLVDGERSRHLLAALSCLSLLSAVAGAVFLKRRVRAEQSEELPSHFIEIND